MELQEICYELATSMGKYNVIPFDVSSLLDSASQLQSSNTPNAPTELRQLLMMLRELAQRQDPSLYFNLDAACSPPPPAPLSERLVPKHGYTVSCWLRLSAVIGTTATLFCFQTAEKSKVLELRIVPSSAPEYNEFSFAVVHQEGVQRLEGFDLVPGAESWMLLVVTQLKNIFSLMINGRCVSQLCSVPFPQQGTEPLLFDLSGESTSSSYWSGQLGAVEVLSGCCEASAALRAFSQGAMFSDGSGANGAVIPPELMSGGEWFHRQLLRVCPSEHVTHLESSSADTGEAPHLSALLGFGTKPSTKPTLIKRVVEAHHTLSFKSCLGGVGGMRKVLVLLAGADNPSLVLQVIVGLVSGHWHNFEEFKGANGFELLEGSLSAGCNTLTDEALDELVKMTTMDGSGVIEDPDRFSCPQALQITCSLLCIHELQSETRALLARMVAVKLLCHNPNKNFIFEHVGLDRHSLLAYHRSLLPHYSQTTPLPLNRHSLTLECTEC